MSIPWDDPYDDRPAWLPDVGDPVDAETAALLLAHYGPAIAAALERSEAVVRSRHHDAAVTVRPWTSAELVRDWSADADGVLAAFIMVDDQGHRQRFRSVLLQIDKRTGELKTVDDSRLLAG